MRNLIAFLLLLPACTVTPSDDTPAKVLEGYIRVSFSASSIDDKKKMEDMLTGDTKSRLMAWSDEQFTKAFLGANKKFRELRILENNKVSDQEVAITYELSYEEGAQDKTTRTTQRKLCAIVKEDGSWKIKEVRSIRESIEYLKEFSLP
ncbi:MAG: hypothetical protein EBX52_10265 [Proteobacteria bacterium]|nr:hypothetical protein [Pseudomonadota bacterium]